MFERPMGDQSVADRAAIIAAASAFLKVSMRRRWRDSVTEHKRDAPVTPFGRSAVGWLAICRLVEKVSARWRSLVRAQADRRRRGRHGEDSVAHAVHGSGRLNALCMRACGRAVAEPYRLALGRAGTTAAATARLYQRGQKTWSTNHR